MRTTTQSHMLRRNPPSGFLPCFGIAVVLSLTASATPDDPTDYEELCHEGLNTCFEESIEPGCNDPACCKVICEVDEFCCTVAWDTFCVDFAEKQCEELLPCPNGGSCFDVGDPEEPGCDDELCCELVCGFDPFCCNGYWDDLCVELAHASCTSPLCELPDPSPNEIPEPEECDERINDGCNMATPEFVEIGCGEMYRGTAFSGGPRDTDWYRFNVGEPGEYTWTITSEFPATVLVMTGQCDHDLRIRETAYGGDCTPASITFTAEPGDTYFLFVSPGTPGGPLRAGVRCPPDEDDKGDDPPPPTHFGIEYIAHLSSDVCPPTIPGDLNGDGEVDGADLLILLSNWGECADPGDCLGDLNTNDVVDGADLLILLQNWG